MDWRSFLAGWFVAKVLSELVRWRYRRRLERADLMPSTRLVIRAVLRKYGAPGLFD